MLDEAGHFNPLETQAQFTIASRDPVEVVVLPPLMRRIALGAPLIDLRIVQVRRRTIEAGLASGTLDLAIDVPLPLSENVRRRRITADRLVVVARQDHPQVRPGFTPATYLAQQHVMVTSRRKGLGFEDLALSQRDLQRRVRLRCRDYAAAFRVVSETDLVLTMAERYAGVLNAGFGNQILSLPIEMPTLDGYLYWHYSVDNDPANRWLRALVSEALSADAHERVVREADQQPEANRRL